jgi:hypothetical protein
MLDIRALRGAPLANEPFPHFVAENVLTAASLQAVNRDFPAIKDPGIFPADEMRAGPAFTHLLREIEGVDLESALSEKYGIDLHSLPLMVTVRGFCRQRDGKIHVDSVDKVVTCLLYLNMAIGAPAAAGSGCCAAAAIFRIILPKSRRPAEPSYRSGEPPIPGMGMRVFPVRGAI